MKESRNYYNKGVKYFHKGELEKAIANLDIAISHDMKNCAALNLRGMIYYIKGQGEKAVISWKINVSFNDDNIAKTYIDSYEEDTTNDYRYKNALIKMKQLDIDGAIELLEEAAKSDYNILNIRNALAYCYMKKLNFEKAKNNSEIVLDKDCNNKIAKDNLKIIKRELGLKSRLGNKKIVAVLAFMVVILGGVFVAKNTDGNKLAMIEKNPPLALEKDEEKEKHVDNSKEEVIKEETTKENVNALVYSTEELQDAIKDDEYDRAHKMLKSMENEKFSDSDKKIVDDAIAIMKKDGLENFYKKAISEFKDKNFGKAKDIFIKASEYSKGSYLEEHITYMLAICFESLEDNKSALKYYDEYASKDYDDDSGVYMAEVLYKLAILNAKGDLSQSKKFANKIANEYSDSIYNNNYIKSILNN